jgi:hypothetical protein
MTESKLRKRIIDIKLGGARNKNRRKQAILLTDSKGKYLEEELSTESYLQLKKSALARVLKQLKCLKLSINRRTTMQITMHKS